MDITSEPYTSNEDSGPSCCVNKDCKQSNEEHTVLNIIDNSLHCDNIVKNNIFSNNANGNVSDIHSTNPPILISTLTLTEDHPLMTCSSPDSPSTGNFPNFIVNSHEKSDKCKNNQINRDYCVESLNRNINGEMCTLFGEGFSPHNGPQRNTSKNNLYFSDNVVSPESNKSLDSDELRNYVDAKFYIKSKLGADLVDPDIKFNNVSTSDKHFSICNKFNGVDYQIKNTVTQESNDSIEIIEHNTVIESTVTFGSNIPQSSFCNFKKEDSISIQALQEGSHNFILRKNSWSNSDSSVDSLCNCSIISEEDENLICHHKTENGEQLPEDNMESERIPEYSLKDERTDSRKWLKIVLPSGERKSVDMKVIEPYKRVLSHGGYASSGRRDAIVVFSACFLPDSRRVDYNYVMDNLFLYVLTTMEQLVTDEYILIYLHGSASKRSMPTFHWLKKCYQLIDRRLRKNLKHLYLVHPTFWLKSVVFMTRPFISSKFFNKLTYVRSLDDLTKFVPVEYAAIPERVRRFDSLRS